MSSTGSRESSRHYNVQEQHGRQNRHTSTRARSRSRSRSPQRQSRQNTRPSRSKQYPQQQQARQQQSHFTQARQQRSHFTQARPYISLNQRKINLLTRLNYATQKNQGLLERIINGLETSASPTPRAQPPMPPPMPPLEDYEESIASTGSITTQYPSSPMSALQGYNSEPEHSGPDFGLDALKYEFGHYPNVD